jgi:HKD family nuclease
MVRLLETTSKVSKAFDELFSSCRQLHFAVAWASTGFKQYQALVDAKQRIGRGVVGTHFYQTAPDFIAKFSRSGHVRFMKSSSGVFHPKVFVFEMKTGEWACIVGSSNFTRGGFTKNDEVSLLVTNADDPSGDILKKAKASIDRYWRQAIPGYEIDLQRYREMQNRFATTLARASGQFGMGKAGLAFEDIDILNIGWREFFAKVKADRHHSLVKRLKVLAAARTLFLENRSFEAMSDDHRKGIAGFKGDDDMPWGWFGSMTGAGVFKRIVNRHPDRFSQALNSIPLIGPVFKEQYLSFIRHYVKAFPVKNGKPIRHGLATATRLLAMKRPDYFVCLDSANRRNILRAFKGKLKNDDYEGYWDKIVERLVLAKWWSEPCPLGGNARGVWEGRAAMLDAIYYAPSTSR